MAQVSVGVGYKLMNVAVAHLGVFDSVKSGDALFL